MSSIGEILWVEKYRPKSLSDIVNQKEIVERLKKFVDEKNMPHLLFAGPAGTGKCVAPDTPVLTSEGVKAIGEVVDGYFEGEGQGGGFRPARIRVYSLGPEGLIRPSLTSHVFKGVSSRTVMIELESGKFVETTPEHPLLVVGPHGEPEWIPAEEVRAGYYVATPRVIRLGGLEGSDRLTLLASLAGLLEALGGRAGYGPYCGDRSVVSLASRLLEKAYGPKYRHAPGVAGDPCIEVPRSVVERVYSELGIRGGRPGPMVPPILWESFEGLAAYAKSLLTGFRETKGSHELELGSREAAEEVSYALTAIGLKTELRESAGRAIIRVKPEEGDAAGLRASEWIRWERVARVTVSGGGRVVYDLTVPGYGNFIGGHGPLILHNTTAAHALAHDLYGENYRQYVLELNASVSKDTPILVKIWGLTLRATFEELDKLYFSDGSFARVGDGEYARADGLEVLTYDEASGRVVWRRASWIIRHRAGKILRVKIKGGGELGLTGNHSVMVLDDSGRLVEKSAKDLRPGDYLISFTAILHGGRPARPSAMDSVQLERLSRNPSSPQYSRIASASGEGHVLALDAGNSGASRAEATITPVASRDQAAANSYSTTLDYGGARIGLNRDDRIGRGLLPSRPFARFLREASYAIRQDSVAWKLLGTLEDRRVLAKEEALMLLSSINESELSEEHKEALERLRRLASSEIHVLEVESVELVDYDDYVYDVSVPGNNMFFAGSVPVLLHNSDERGINVIREKVKEFARSRSPAGIPFKIVILDEADNMKSDAQQALRRLMELFSASTRFILIANYPSKIIDPIQSRCAYFRFQPLKKEDIIERLRYIAESEGVEYDEEALETIYEISEGDMRKAINILQSSAALGKVTVESVFRVVGMAKPKEIRDMIKLALSGDFTSARTMLRKLMIEYGLSGEDVVRQIHKEIMGPDIKISDDLRVLISDYLGEIHYRMVEGSDEDIQLSAFLAWLAMIGKKVGGRG